MSRETHRLLIADHAPHDTDDLKQLLETDGIEVTCVTTGVELLSLLRSRVYDCIMIDMHLPDLDGFALLKAIRKDDAGTPVILTAVIHEDYDVLTALSLGADEYIKKPYNPLLLSAQIQALIRRFRFTPTLSMTSVVAGEFEFNPFTMRFYKQNRPLSFSAKEGALMKLFLTNIDRVFSKQEIYELVWGSSVTDDNVVMIYINRLRKKVEDDPSMPRHIETLRGTGYRFVL